MESDHFKGISSHTQGQRAKIIRADKKNLAWSTASSSENLGHLP